MPLGQLHDRVADGEAVEAEADDACWNAHVEGDASPSLPSVSAQLSFTNARAASAVERAVRPSAPDSVAVAMPLVMEVADVAASSSARIRIRMAFPS